MPVWPAPHGGGAPSNFGCPLLGDFALGTDEHPVTVFCILTPNGVYLVTNWCTLRCVAQTKQKRINLRVQPKFHAYLEELASAGIHGDTPTEVAKVLLTLQVERLVREGFIRMRFEE